MGSRDYNRGPFDLNLRVGSRFTLIKRDRKNSKQLRKEGWTVLRFWDHDINKSLDECVKKVKSKLDVLI